MDELMLSTQSRFGYTCYGFCNRRALLAFLLAGVSVAHPAASWSATAAVGRVSEVQAAAFLERASGRAVASKGSDIFLADTAITGDQPARLGLQLGGATRVRLGANTVFKVEQFVAGNTAVVQLTSGPTYIERGHSAEPNFELLSPFARLAARGTAFFAGPSNGVFGVFVREGTVEVSTQAGAVVLHAGQGTDVPFPGAAPTPVKAWGRARVRAALTSVD